MIKVDKTFEGRRIPNIEYVNPADKNSPEYYRDVLMGFYSAYIRGTTGISYNDVGVFSENRAYGMGKHNTDEVKTFLTGKTQYPTDGVLSTFSTNQRKSIVDMARKAWDNIDWSPISPMPKIKAINSKLTDIDYDVIADPIDPFSRERDLDKKSYAMFFADFQDFLRRFADNAGIPLDEPDFVPASPEEMEMYIASEGFKTTESMDLEMLMKYTFEFSDYQEISRQHNDDIQDFGIKAMKVVKDPNSGRFYVDYVDPAEAFVQASKYNDYRDSEYAGEFTSVTVSKLRAYGATDRQLKAAMKYYSGWNGNIEVSDEFDNLAINRLEDDYFNMKVCVISGAWIDCDKEYRKNYTDNRGNKRTVPQSGDEWGKVYNNPNRKTTTHNVRVVRQGNWVVGTDFVYGYGKMTNQPREEDRNVMLPYVFYRLPYTPIVEACKPFIRGLQTGWAKLQNALVVAMNSGYAINISMLNNLTHGKDKIDWYDAVKLMRGMGVLPFSQSFTGRYEGGAVTPVTPIQGGIGEMLKDAISIMELNMNNIYTFTGMNPLQMAEQTDPNMPVRTSQMMLNAANDVLKPYVRASFKIKQSSARIINAMLATAMGDEGYMNRAYGGVLGKAAVKRLALSKKTGAEFGINLRVRPTDEEKQRLFNAADMALQAQLIDVAIHNYIVEHVAAGANLKRMRMYLSYMIQKEKERKAQEQKDIIKSQSEGVIQQRQVEMQAEQAKSQFKAQGEIAVEREKQKLEIEKNKKLEVEKRVTAIMSEMAKDETQRENLLKIAQNEAAISTTDEGAGTASPDAIAGGGEAVPVEQAGV